MNQLPRWEGIVRRKNFMVMGMIILQLGNVSFATEVQSDPIPPSPAPSIPYSTANVDLAALDLDANPCEDFYQYACGGWIKNTTIPEDRAQWSRGFSVIDEKNLQLLRQSLTDYSEGKKTPENPYSTALGDYFGTCMDESRAETASLKTLKTWMNQIDGLESKKDLPPLIARLHLMGVNVLFGLGSEQDLLDPNLVIATVDQGGLGLPDRDYYLKSDAKTVKIQKSYREHLKRMLMLYGMNEFQAKKAARNIYRFERKLAEVSMDRVERRDPRKIYHRLEKAGLAHLVTQLDWTQYFTDLGYPHIEAINVKTPDFFGELSRLLGLTSLDTLKTYFKWQLLHASSTALGKRFVDENFDFYAKTLSGQKKLAPRWKRCVQSTVDAMGFAIGRTFVDLSYGKNGKKISQEMIQNVERVFKNTLEHAKWMDDHTRAEAMKKLQRIFNKIGYPDHWRNYDALKVGRKSYLENRFAAEEFSSRYELNKIGKPLDRSEWEMAPSTVNAYYEPSLNEMVFPAGILQSPFFDPKGTPIANYSGIGMVMGHELTHGFDDQGRQFDADGGLRDWWSPEVSKEFDKRAACVIHQYDSYTIDGDLHVNGKLTVGENVADLGGIKAAFSAWSLDGTPSQKDKQEFFIHFAQTWCTKTKPELERLKIKVDPHSPPKMRVNGPLADFGEFSAAFGCSLGSKMNPPDRCTVW